MINWELWKKLKFDQAKKWFMHIPESVRKNEMHKLLWDSEIQTDHLISARRPDFVIINNNNNNKKKTCWIVDLAVPADQSKIEGKQKEG